MHELHQVMLFVIVTFWLDSEISSLMVDAMKDMLCVTRCCATAVTLSLCDWRPSWNSEEQEKIISVSVCVSVCAERVCVELAGRWEGEKVKCKRLRRVKLAIIKRLSRWYYQRKLFPPSFHSLLNELQSLGECLCVIDRRQSSHHNLPRRKRKGAKKSQAWRTEDQPCLPVLMNKNVFGENTSVFDAYAPFTLNKIRKFAEHILTCVCACFVVTTADAFSIFY